MSDIQTGNDALLEFYISIVGIQAGLALQDYERLYYLSMNPALTGTNQDMFHSFTNLVEVIFDLATELDEMLLAEDNTKLII